MAPSTAAQDQKDQNDLMMMLGRIIATQDATAKNIDALAETIDKHVQRDERMYDQIKLSIKELDNDLDERITAAEEKLNWYAGIGAALAVAGMSVWQLFFTKATGG